MFGSQDSFPIAVIILLILMSLFGDTSNTGQGAQKLQSQSENEASFFALEITPSTQSVPHGETARFVVHYDNESSRALENVRLRAIVPNGADFDFPRSAKGWRRSDLSSSGSGVEYFLGRINAGELGSVSFSEKILATTPPISSIGDEDLSRETSIIALWDEEQSSLRADRTTVSGQAVVMAMVALDKNKKKETQETFTQNIPAKNENENENIGAKSVQNSLSLLTTSSQSAHFFKNVSKTVIGWIIFFALFISILFIAIFMVRVESREKKKMKEGGKEGGADKKTSKKEENKEEKEKEKKQKWHKLFEGFGNLGKPKKKGAKRAAPPDNLPI